MFASLIELVPELEYLSLTVTFPPGVVFTVSDSVPFVTYFLSILIFPPLAGVLAALAVSRLLKTSLKLL